MIRRPAIPGEGPADALDGANDWSLRSLGTLLAILIFVVFVAVCGSLYGLLAAPFMILFGWITFLVRVLSQVEWNWHGLATALGCLLVLGGVLHWLGRWVAAWPNIKFTWRWTKAPVLLVGVVALFWAGLAGIGLVRTTHWLLRTDQLFDDSHFGRSRTQSLNNLKQMVIGAHCYNDAMKSMPAGAIFDRHGQALHSWQTALLPYVEQDELYNQIRLDLPWNHEVNRRHFRTRVAVFDDRRLEIRGEFAETHYAANIYVLGARALQLAKDYPDGLSNTLFIGEAAGNYMPWGQPGNWRDPGLGLNRGPHTFGHPRKHGVCFALADGSVRYISDKISPATLKALATPAGGESINDPEWEP